MTKHTITLSEPLAAYLDRRLADGDYASASDYLADLVDRDRIERTEAAKALGMLLDQAEESGISERSLDEILVHARSPGRKAAGAA